jgi:hypothetical protein
MGFDMGNSCEHPPAVETNEGVVAFAGVLGSFGVVAFGCLGLVAAARNSFDIEWVLGAVGFVLTGGALGFGSAGLAALLCGAKLDRRFTYPFMVYFASLVGPIVLISLDSPELKTYEPLFLEGWVVCLVLGIVFARFLSKRIHGYLWFARACAAIGTIPMIAWGIIHLSGPHDTSVWSKFTTEPGAVIMLVIVLSWVGLIGGSLGAVVGAVIDSLLWSGKCRSDVEHES